MFFLPEILYSIGALALTYAIYNKIHYIRRERHFVRRYGCQRLRRMPQADKILGIDTFLRVAKALREHRYLEHLSSKFEQVGSTYGVRVMGDEMIVTNEPVNVQAVLATHFTDFEIGKSRSRGSEQMLGSGVFNSDGRAWERGRALIRPHFVKSQVADLDIFEKNFMALVDVLPENGTAVDIQEWMFRFTLDTGTEFLFGENSRVLRKDATELAKSFAWAFSVSLDCIAQRARLGKFASLYYDRRYKDACKTVHSFVDPIVQRAMSRNRKLSGGMGQAVESDERYTFIDFMTREAVSPIEVRDQVLNVLTAARDTTAAVISAAIFELSHREEVLFRLRCEVATLQGRLPTYQEIKNMKYLNFIIKETLRLYPPVPINGRVAVRDTCLPSGGGEDGQAPIFVAKGTLIVYQVYSMHRRRDLWGDDAHEFKPDRWETARPRLEYLPFNAGPRICLGQQFALAECAYVLIRLLQTYAKVESRDDGAPWVEKLTLTCSIKQGVWIGLTRQL